MLLTDLRMQQSRGDFNRIHICLIFKTFPPSLFMFRFNEKLAFFDKKKNEN
jgi:hypothetical protein